MLRSSPGTALSYSLRAAEQGMVFRVLSLNMVCTSTVSVLVFFFLGEVPLGIFGGGVPPDSPNPDPISAPKNVIFCTRFQTKPLKSIPVFRPGL